MKLNKIVFTGNENIKNNLITKYNIVNEITNDNFIIYESNRELYKDEENIIICYFTEFNEAFEYISSNYDFHKIIILGSANITSNIDLNIGDVIIPNTFLDPSDKPIFLEYSVGENFDLNKFGLSLNGICYSLGDKDTNNLDADISDKDSYNQLVEIKKNNFLDKTVIVKLITDTENEIKYVDNLFGVLELVL